MKTGNPKIFCREKSKQEILRQTENADDAVGFNDLMEFDFVDDTDDTSKNKIGFIHRMRSKIKT